jgi:hypothetical protein
MKTGHTDVLLRKQKCCQLLVVHSRRSFLHNGHESNMGYQDAAYGTSQPEIKCTRCSTTLALQIDFRRSQKDVHDGRVSVFLLRAYAGTAWPNACCRTVPSLRISQDSVYRPGNGHVGGWGYQFALDGCSLGQRVEQNYGELCNISSRGYSDQASNSAKINALIFIRICSI